MMVSTVWWGDYDDDNKDDDEYDDNVLKEKEGVENYNQDNGMGYDDDGVVLEKEDEEDSHN